MPYLLYIIETIVLTILLGFVGIPLAKKYKARQSIRTEGPKSHRAKAGTPTMGGLFMILAAVLVTVCNHFMTETVIWLIILTLGHCLLGFLDDFIKAEKKRNLGLTAKQKFTGQILLALLFCYGVSHALNLPFAIAIPFTKVDISIGWLYYPFIVLVIVGASNAVNLTDGLDGLAAGCCVIAFIAYAIYSLWLGMSDVASFASVILQVASFQLTGKRIFKMSPLHHHFELSGWSEVHVVWFFWFIEAVAAAGTLFLAIRLM